MKYLTGFLTFAFATLAWWSFAYRHAPCTVTGLVGAACFGIMTVIYADNRPFTSA